MLRTRLFEIDANWKVVVFWVLRFQWKGVRRKRRSVETLSGTLCACEDPLPVILGNTLLCEGSSSLGWSLVVGFYVAM